ncbi:carbohydrate ABC transporter permease, partial [candidate division KSB1 bacterium]|nr:carbohydrate ABC transporter permease [candidate division KSB1 bacterium]NIW68557.1 carbohydrate ABC transporter permease [candidate division KSB1 bacterium]NIX70164.1 carbohydrate ABC transporter permease [candidate division KSB1 bacterium]
MNIGRKIALAGIFRHAVLMIGAAVVLAPFIWALSISFRPNVEMFRPELHLIPEQWYIVENYSRAFSEAPLIRFIFNGMIVCASIFILQALFALP